MYNWCFLFVVLHKPTLLPSTFKYGIFIISVNDIHGKLWGDDINSLAYSYCLFKKCFDENYGSEIQLFFFYLPYVYAIYIKFSLFCSIGFLLFLLTQLKPGPHFSFKRTLYSEKNMNSLNVEYFLAMNIQNLDKNW